MTNSCTIILVITTYFTFSHVHENVEHLITEHLIICLMHLYNRLEKFITCEKRERQNHSKTLKAGGGHLLERGMGSDTF